MKQVTGPIPATAIRTIVETVQELRTEAIQREGLGYPSDEVDEVWQWLKSVNEPIFIWHYQIQVHVGGHRRRAMTGMFESSSSDIEARLGAMWLGGVHPAIYTVSLDDGYINWIEIPLYDVIAVEGRPRTGHKLVARRLQEVALATK